MWPKISRTVIRWGLRHEIDSRLHHFHDASFTELFWIRKIILFTPATPGHFTEQAMKQEIFIENIWDLVMGINKLFRFAFQYSVYRVHTLFNSLVCIFRLLITSEYLLKIKIFMAFIRSSVFVEKLTKVLKDKHFPLTFECLILIRWISFTHFRPRQLYWDPKIVIRILD